MTDVVPQIGGRPEPAAFYTSLSDFGRELIGNSARRGANRELGQAVVSPGESGYLETAFIPHPLFLIVMSNSATPSDGFDPLKITRPDKALMWYYLIVSLPGFLTPLLPLFFKYETLRYRFDDEGVSMSWGILFRREIYLTYRRIQDIHLTRNILQRWLGLATVSVQTASGSSSPEMSIEGILQADALRDFLYVKMRGARDHSPRADPRDPATDTAAPVHGDPVHGDPVHGDPVHGDPVHGDQALELLRDIRDALGQLASRRGAGG
jgi:putative membrane protein